MTVSAPWNGNSVADSPYYVPADYGGASARYQNRYLGFEGHTGVLTVSWDFRPIVKLLQRLHLEFYSADKAVRQAHGEMAALVAGYAQEALEEEISHRGPRGIGPREQKSSKALVNALTDPRNWDANSSGFSVGYLDRFRELVLYWRRIEEGSNTQVGQTFYGAFLTGDKWSHPSSNEAAQTDLRLIKFSAVGPLTRSGTYTSHAQRALEGTENTGGRTSVVTIKRAIQPYHYLSQGFARFLGAEGKFAGGGVRETVLGFYERAFAENNMVFLDRWARRYGAHLPSGAYAQVAKHYGGG